MATVHIPAHWRDRTDGRATVEVPGRSLGAVVEGLVHAYPDMRDALFEGSSLRSEVAVAINSVVTDNGLLEPIEDRDDIFLIPAIAGGAG